LLSVLLLAVTVAPLARAGAGGWTSAAALGLALAAAALRVWPASTGAARGLLPFALGAAALVVIGQERLGWPYGFCIVAFVALSLRSLALGVPRVRLDARSRRVAPATLALASVLAGAGAVGLPRLEGWAQRAFGRLFLSDPAVAAFSDRMRLGSMRAMLDNDEVVLRVFGRPVDYLRGALYDQYDSGRWSGSHWAPLRTIASSPEPPNAEVIEQRSGHPYFLPLGVCALGSGDGPLAADGSGIVTSGEGRRPSRSFFDPVCGAPAAPVRSPRDADRELSAGVRPSVTRAAEAWTATATTPLAKVEAIETRLRAGFRYSLDVERDARVDPVVDFLERHRAGHCEYFASAMALVCRAAGVPARVVAGYRVGERNILGGWWVVRQRNAHAWVEAWVDGAWRTFDPTPPSAFDEAGRASFVTSLADRLARAWERATPRDIVGVAAGLGAALVAWLAVPWLAVRWLRRRDQRATQRAARTQPPAGFEDLERSLERQGQVRSASEPIEAFAARLLAPAPDEAKRRAAELLLRYCRYIYGGEGDLASLAHDARQWGTEQVTRAPWSCRTVWPSRRGAR
jgi:hypothetical protein